MNRTLLFAIVAMLICTPVYAWEVKLAPDGWKSMYCTDVPGVGTQCRDTGSRHSGVRPLSGNEHAEITDHVFWSINPEIGRLFGTHACVTEEQADANCPLMVDLNASWLRRNVLDGTSTAGDDLQTPLEERRQPPLAMWASLPDYGYTVYDWANKMRICPSLPKTAQHRNFCHDYGAWLGGGLNSTHFGWLPMRIYQRYHAIARAQAARAKELRTRLGSGDNGLPAAGAAWHEDYVRETEMLALVYETVGQHFVADRWATGHMIGRWGPGSYEHLPKVNGVRRLEDAVQFGILTGMLHGSQAVFGAPDPLNSPFLHNSGASGALNFLGGDWDKNTGGTLSTWRYTAENALSPPTQVQGGVGDLAFEALLDRSYKGVPGHTVDPAISLASATNQRKAMMYCMAQGVRHVIADLGENGQGFGSQQLELPETDKAELQYEWVPGSNRLGQDPSQDPLCTSHWVTNDAYYAGIRTIAGQNTVVGDVIVVATSADGAPSGWVPNGTILARAGLAYTKARAIAARQVEWDKENREVDGKVRYGTELARNSPSFKANGFYWRGNKQYPVPGYYEPVDLDSIDELDNEYGKDKYALYGLFNKAGTHYWCENLHTKLQELRDEIQTAAPLDKPRLVATCAYLANRTYRGVADDYSMDMDAPRKELVGNFLPQDEATKFGPTYEPICRWFEPDHSNPTFKTDDASDDTKPYYIHPGYVESKGDFGDYSPTSLENWCQKKPVMNVSVVENNDQVFKLNHTSSRWIEIRGKHLGMKTPSGAVGKVEVKNDDGQWVDAPIYDDSNMTASGGWSLDGEVLYARIPMSQQGITSSVTLASNPQDIYSATSKFYEIRLTRPNDPMAEPMYMADGEQTVGTYTVEIQPAILEVQLNQAFAGTTELRAEYCHPKWISDRMTQLQMGLYRKVGQTYSRVDFPYTWVEPISWTPTPSVQCDEERAGILITNPDPQVFDGNVVAIFAYH